MKDKGDREQEQAWRASRSQSRSDHYESSAVSARLTGSKAGVTPYLVALPGTVMGWEQPGESMASA